MGANQAAERVNVTQVDEEEEEEQEQNSEMKMLGVTRPQFRMTSVVRHVTIAALGFQDAKGRKSEQHHHTSQWRPQELLYDRSGQSKEP